MPLSGNTYVAPNWVDQGPPALDAEELNAISQTLVALQNGEISLQDAINALTTTVSGKAKIISGSYVGTGLTSYSLISCGFTPKMVLVTNGSGYSGSNNNFGFAIPSHPARNNRGEEYAEIAPNGFNVRRTSNSYINETGQTSYYVAIGF